ncbi:hypothetical protein MKW98_017337 [Papaver atlanticum]|uniref:Importin N-terminal domain-containing protein n=1 Tax=Papaver atlanticum TaxID=357466 RepID=A0AAD4SSD0_9MAGN|nr:hypothetical protein MKW98_017337 [Papaver atlanticum]
MAYTVDQDQQWLLNCLTATLDTNHEVRLFAETSLNQASSQPGFGSALSKVAIGSCHWDCVRYPFHWQEDDENFEHPVVQREEKAVIRNLLLPSLDDPHGKVCTAVGMAVASIVQYDWPDLLPALLKLMNDQTNISGVRGALRCLALVAGDLDDTTVPSLIYDKVLRVRALSIVYSCISVLGSMSSVYKTETSELDRGIEVFEPVRSEFPNHGGRIFRYFCCLNLLMELLRGLCGRHLYHLFKYMRYLSFKPHMILTRDYMIQMVKIKVWSNLSSSYLKPLLEVQDSVSNRLGLEVSWFRCSLKIWEQEYMNISSFTHAHFQLLPSSLLRSPQGSVNSSFVLLLRQLVWMCFR